MREAWSEERKGKDHSGHLGSCRSMIRRKNHLGSCMRHDPRKEKGRIIVAISDHAGAWSEERTISDHAWGMIRGKKGRTVRFAISDHARGKIRGKRERTVRFAISDHTRGMIRGKRERTSWFAFSDYHLGSCTRHDPRKEGKNGWRRSSEGVKPRRKSTRKRTC